MDYTFVTQFTSYTYIHNNVIILIVLHISLIRFQIYSPLVYVWNGIKLGFIYKYVKRTLFIPYSLLRLRRRGKFIRNIEEILTLNK